jgi:hypothetical protein
MSRVQCEPRDLMSKRVVVVLLLCLGFGSKGEPQTVVNTIVTGQVARNLLDEAATQAQALLLSAQQNANATLARLANELNVAAANLRIAIGQDVDKKIGALSIEIQKASNALAALLAESRQFRIGIVDLKDSTVLDIKDIFDDTWLASGRTGFFVQRIDGLLQLEQSLGGSYRVGVFGLGFGPKSEERSGDIEWIKLGGRYVRARTHTPRAHYTELEIQNAELASLFKNRQLVSIPLQIGVVVRTDRVLSSIRGPLEERHVVTFHLSLLSTYAGSVKVYSESPTESWVTVGPVSFAHTTPTVGNWQGFSTETSVPINEQFIGPTSYTHHSHGCGWTRGWSTAIVNEGHTLRLTGEIQGASCAAQYHATLQRKTAGPNSTAIAEQELQYGQLVTVDLPPGTKWWRVMGVSATRRPIDIVKCGSDETLQCVDVTSVGDITKVTFKVLPPTGF